MGIVEILKEVDLCSGSSRWFLFCLYWKKINSLDYGYVLKEVIGN